MTIPVREWPIIFYKFYSGRKALRLNTVCNERTKLRHGAQSHGLSTQFIGLPCHAGKIRHRRVPNESLTTAACVLKIGTRGEHWVIIFTVLAPMLYSFYVMNFLVINI